MDANVQLKYKSGVITSRLCASQTNLGTFDYCDIKSLNSYLVRMLLPYLYYLLLIGTLG